MKRKRKGVFFFVTLGKAIKKVSVFRRTNKSCVKKLLTLLQSIEELNNVPSFFCRTEMQIMPLVHICLLSLGKVLLVSCKTKIVNCLLEKDKSCVFVYCRTVLICFSLAESILCSFHSQTGEFPVM